MSVNPNYNVRGTILELWTDIEDQNSSLEAHIDCSDQMIDSVSIPFYYWHSVGYAQLFAVGVEAFNKTPDTDANGQALPGYKYPRGITSPDIHGRLVIALNGRVKLNGEMIHNTLREAKNRIKQREGWHDPIFGIFIPLSTRTVGETVQSLFPFFRFGQDRSKDKLMTELSTTIPVGIVAVIMDLATMIIRLVTLIPRFIYQHYFQTNDPVEGITVQTTGSGFNWGRGVIRFYAYGEDMVSGSRDNGASYFFCRAGQNLYLGS